MRRKRTFTTDDRGVSTALTHVLTIGITTILISGLFIGTTTMLESQKDRAAYQEMETIGDRLATEITAVDQAANRTPTGSATVLVEHPDTVAGSSYRVRLATGSSACNTWDPNTCLILSATQTSEDIEVPFRNVTAVEPASITGGDVRVRYDASDEEITLEAA